MNTYKHPHDNQNGEVLPSHRRRSGFGFITALAVPLAAIALIAVSPMTNRSQTASKSDRNGNISMVARTPQTTRDDTTSADTQSSSGNPTQNLAPQPNFFNDCSATFDSSAGCQAAALQAIDNGRASEGLAPMELPTNWAQLSAAEQLFVATNLERTVRGLPAFEGMSSALDQSAASASSANTDPVPPSGFYASFWTSNWAGGVGSALESIYLWMYDDGPGSPNANCQGGDTSGCWGHRDDILASFSCSPCVVGSAVDTNAYEGEPSWAELMAATSGSPALSFAWSQVSWGAPSTTVVGMTATASQGYWLVTAGGTVRSFGGAPYYGSATMPAGLRVVGIAATPDGHGYWITTSHGNVLTFGDAHQYGSTADVRLAAPVVGIASTSDGRGYWLVASDGGVFCFGDAVFHGSTGAMRLNRPVVGIAATSDGRGYWLVASDGGIFSFGDAAFHGSTGGIRLNRPVVGMTPTLDGLGYWLVASDGGIFSFGDATFHGSTGNIRLAAPVVGMSSPGAVGYWLVASDGGIFSFGVPYHGSMA
jgi:hypothetical protein